MRRLPRIQACPAPPSAVFGNDGIVWFKGMAFFAMCLQLARTTVVSLLSSGRPLAICWRIIPIVVDPFKAHAVRHFSHIFKKVFKQHPALAHFYSASAVPRVIGRPSIVATIPHAFPRHMSSCAALSMSPVDLARNLSEEAPARLTFAARNAGQRYDLFSPTITPASPSCSAAVKRYTFNQCPTSAPFA